MANIFLDMLQRKGSREISLLSLIWGVLTFSDNKTINDEVVLGDRFFILSVMGMTFSSLDEIANDNKGSIDCHYST